MSNGTANVAVKRSENANERMNKFVGLLRRLLLVIIALQTMRFPRTATATIKGAMSPNTHARANENKLEKDGPTFSSCVGDFGRLFLSV